MWSKTSRTGGPPLRAWHLLVLAFALAGLTKAPRPIAAALLAFAAFHLIVVAMPRYALPVLPVLIAAGAGGWGAGSLTSRRQPKQVPPARRGSLRRSYGVVVDRVNVSVLL